MHHRHLRKALEEVNEWKSGDQWRGPLIFQLFMAPTPSNLFYNWQNGDFSTLQTPSTFMSALLYQKYYMWFIEKYSIGKQIKAISSNHTI